MQSAPTPFLYLHGFASGPSSEKATFYRKRLAEAGVDLQVLDLNEGDDGFFGLTVSRSLAHVDAALDRSGAGEGDAVLIGSSLGGYTAALAASRDPRIGALILMAPAFDLPARWTHLLGAEGVATWRSEKKMEVDHYATGRKEAISFRFYLDAMGHPPYPRVACPTLILHGVDDAEVPVGTSRKFASLSPTARLVELPSDHSLTDVLERLWDESTAFLREVRALP